VFFLLALNISEPKKKNACCATDMHLLLKQNGIKIMIMIINNKSVSKTKTNKQNKIFESENFYLYSKDVLERLERVI